MPDLVLIDGGKGQVGVARARACATWACTRCASSAWRRDPSASPGMEELIVESEARSAAARARRIPALHLIQQIRDEAHRFAIVGPPRAARQERAPPRC